MPTVKWSPTILSRALPSLLRVLRGCLVLGACACASLALLGCKNTQGCDPNEPCECSGGADCYLGCTGNGCSQDCHNVGDSCGTVCNDNCTSECHDTNDCSSSCGNGCTLSCHNTPGQLQALRAGTGGNPRLRRGIAERGGPSNYWFVPVVLQWNFWLTRQWSVFAEPGLSLYGSDDARFGATPALFLGGRFRFSRATTLTFRLGYPTVTIGVSFLL
jgi:hypothetical protein